MDGLRDDQHVLLVEPLLVFRGFVGSSTKRWHQGIGGEEGAIIGDYSRIINASLPLPLPHPAGNLTSLVTVL
jgi:hypothetical protein